MFYNILDNKRKLILPLLRNFKDDFYLAGGTGLALQIGHRDSIDFDFFSKNDINTDNLFLKIREIFNEHKILKAHEESNTLTVYINKVIQLSFFTYKYPLISDLIDEPYLKIASITDIACMKLSAIVSRATIKDYVDLYYILQKIPLKLLLEKLNKKMPELETNLVLKSLVYFKDIKEEPIKFKNDEFINLKTIEKFLTEEIRTL